MNGESLRRHICVAVRFVVYWNPVRGRGFLCSGLRSNAWQLLHHGYNTWKKEANLFNFTQKAGVMET